MSEQIQYIGARYVVKIYENSTDPSSAEWEPHVNYEPLVMVTLNNGSYLSKKDVPASVGNPADNPNYWAQTGFYNGQISALEHQIEVLNTALTTETDTRANADTALSNAITTLTNNLGSETTARANADNSLSGRIDAEVTARTNAVNTLTGAIANEASARQSADASLQTQIDALIAPSGEAPSAAEVENARIGVDRSYSTLGNAIREQHSNTIEMLKDENVYDLLCDFPFQSSGPYNGVTITVTGQSTFEFSGTATALSNFNLFADASHLIPNGEFDKMYLLDIEGTMPTGVSLARFSYRNGEWAQMGTYTGSAYLKLGDSSTDTGMILRFVVANGTALNGETIKIRLLTINHNNPIIYPTVGYDSADVIKYCLNNFGKVILAKGAFNIHENITMPDNTRITGSGSGSIIKPNTLIDAITVGANCSIDNIAIEGYYSSSSDVQYAGIKISANYDTPPLIYETKLSNVKISKMGVGILGEKTGYWTGCSISADNIEISNCRRGIKLWKHCEFARFTNINSHDNDLGIELYSGNNKFVNCSFNNNRINCYVTGYTTEGGDEGANNGHGCFVGCDFNHADNNSGISILIKWISTNGFVFDGCNIWYGRVEVDEASTGIIISNCLFGGGTPTINVFGNSDLLLFNNAFKVQPTFNIYGTLVSRDNFLFDGSEITP